MRYTHPYRAFDQVARLRAIVMVIFQRIFDRIWHNNGAREMHNCLHSMVAQRCFHQRLVGDVAHDQRNALRYCPIKAGNEIVDDHNAIAGIRQCQHCMAADITGPARDQDRRLSAHKRRSSRMFREDLSSGGGIVSLFMPPRGARRAIEGRAACPISRSCFVGVKRSPCAAASRSSTATT